MGWGSLPAFRGVGVQADSQIFGSLFLGGTLTGTPVYLSELCPREPFSFKSLHSRKFTHPAWDFLSSFFFLQVFS